MTATVGAASSADVPALLALRRAWCSEQGGDADADPTFADRFAAWFDRGAAHGTRAWLAKVAGDPAGMLYLRVVERTPWPDRPTSCWGYVSAAFVLSAHRDVGVGRMLLDAATAYADRHELARVVVNPTEQSVPFYVRAGFSADHPLLVRTGRAGPRRPVVDGPVVVPGDPS